MSLAVEEKGSQLIVKSRTNSQILKIAVFLAGIFAIFPIVFHEPVYWGLQIIPLALCLPIDFPLDPSRKVVIDWQRRKIIAKDYTVPIKAIRSIVISEWVEVYSTVRHSSEHPVWHLEFLNKEADQMLRDFIKDPSTATGCCVEDDEDVEEGAFSRIYDDMVGGTYFIIKGTHKPDIWDGAVKLSKKMNIPLFNCCEGTLAECKPSELDLSGDEASGEFTFRDPNVIDR